MQWTIALYAQEDHKSPVEDFINSLSLKEQAKSLYYLLLLEQEGNRLPTQYAKHIEGDLWELRPEFGGVEMRYFYFTWVNQMIVIVHAAKKKSQKLPKREIALAQKRVKELKDGTVNPLQLIIK